MIASTPTHPCRPSPGTMLAIYRAPLMTQNPDSFPSSIGALVRRRWVLTEGAQWGRGAGGPNKHM